MLCCAWFLCWGFGWGVRGRGGVGRCGCCLWCFMGLLVGVIMLCFLPYVYLSPSISPFSLNHQIITAILTPPDHRRSLWPPSLRQRQRLHLLCPRPRPDFWKSRWRQDIRREQAGELQERCVVRCGASWGCCALRDWC